MCLSIPGKIVAIEKDRFVVDYGNEQRIAELSLVDVALGDYVIISNKMIVTKLKKEQAQQFLALVDNNA